MPTARERAELTLGAVAELIDAGLTQLAKGETDQAQVTLRAAQRVARITLGEEL